MLLYLNFHPFNCMPLCNHYKMSLKRVGLQSICEHCSLLDIGLYKLLNLEILVMFILLKNNSLLLLNRQLNTIYLDLWRLKTSLLPS